MKYMITAALLCAAMLSGCGSSDSSTDTSKPSLDELKTATSAATAAPEQESSVYEDPYVTTAPESRPDEKLTEPPADSSSDDEKDKEPEKSEPFGKLTKKLVKKAAKNCQLKGTMDLENYSSIPVSLEISGGDQHTVYDFFCHKQEYYTVLGKSYNTIAAIKRYFVGEDCDETDNVGLVFFSEDKTYIDTAKEDGLTVERCVIESETDPGTINYYFDEKGSLVRIEADTAVRGRRDLTVTSIAFKEKDVELPKLKDWKKLDAEKLTEEEQAMTELGTLGITEKMLKDEGYTYKKAAKLETKERRELLEKLNEKHELGLEPLLKQMI